MAITFVVRKIHQVLISGSYGRLGGRLSDKIQGNKKVKVFYKLNGYHTVVFNSRNQPEYIWLQKRMHLHKQHYTNQNTKTYLIAITAALTMLYIHSNKTTDATFVIH